MLMKDEWCIWSKLALNDYKATVVEERIEEIHAYH